MHYWQFCLHHPKTHHKLETIIIGRYAPCRWIAEIQICFDWCRNFELCSRSVFDRLRSSVPSMQLYRYTVYLLGSFHFEIGAPLWLRRFGLFFSQTFCSVRPYHLRLCCCNFCTIHIILLRATECPNWKFNFHGLILRFWDAPYLEDSIHS